MATQRKAKRKLSDISFEQEGAHVALTSKSQGGPANDKPFALVMKSNFSQEFIQKVQQVQVTMELPDFLQKFFYVYGSDAKILAYMMGYVEPADTQEMEKQEAEDEFQSWIEERMSAFTIIKSAHEAEDLNSFLATLGEDDYLALLKDQEVVEKALKNSEVALKATSEEGATEAVAKAKETVTKAEDAPSGETKQKLGKSMDEENQVVQLQKALEDQKALLTKALEQVAAFEAEKKEAIVKAKTAKIETIVKDKAQSAALVKAAVALESEEDFNAFVTSVEALVASVEKSALFDEKGASVVTEEKEVESAVAKAVKAQLSKAKTSK